MRCSYEIEIHAQCPVNPTDTDLYSFVITSESIIEVEKIIAFFAAHAKQKEVFQEALTHKCAVSLGVHVTSVGWHSGVKVICEAP